MISYLYILQSPSIEALSEGEGFQRRKNGRAASRSKVVKRRRRESTNECCGIDAPKPGVSPAAFVQGAPRYARARSARAAGLRPGSIFLFLILPGPSAPPAAVGGLSGSQLALWF